MTTPEDLAKAREISENALNEAYHDRPVHDYLVEHIAAALAEARTTPKPAAEVVEANGWEDHDLFGLCTKTIEAVIGEIVKEVRLHGDERNSNVRSCKYQEAVYSRERENACIGVNQRLRSLISTIESGRRSIEALAAQSAKEKP